LELKEQLGVKTAPKMPLKKLDSIIMATIKLHMDALVQFDDLAETLSNFDPLKDKRNELSKLARAFEKKLNDHENTLATAYTHHLGGLLDMREYELVRTKVESEKTQAEIQLASIKAQQGKYENARILENPWLVKYREFRNCETPTKEMIQALIERIVLTPMTNEVEIVLKYAEDFAELEYILKVKAVA
jgi:EAL domain-containing protein (putative c-di-GMP-specific phosphodiesterase class I)